MLLQPHTALRGEKMLRAMVQAAEAAGVRCTLTDRWQRQAPVLMSYGLGHPERQAWTRRHVRDGGRLIGWDLGYWNRDEPLRFNMRLTIDDEHPHRLLRPMPPERFDAAGIALREDVDPKGPIVLAGLGRKQRVALGLKGQAWELGRLAELRTRFPRATVVYKPKRYELPLPGCRLDLRPIEEVLQGASLLVCGHSNVAIDACIAGVPVECEDGAALALYRDGPAPTREARLAFLRSVAWWQWNPQEAPAAWQFIREQLQA